MIVRMIYFGFNQYKIDSSQQSTNKTVTSIRLHFNKLDKSLIKLKVFPCNKAK